METDDTLQTKAVFQVVAARHIAKCRRGIMCPASLCRRLADAEKTGLVEWFRSSPISKHYQKCRVKPSATAPEGCKCWCWLVRASMIEIKKRCFPEVPMSLELLSICAISAQYLSVDEASHPMKDEILLIVNAARLVQRRWKEFLRARGMYRTELCRFYIAQECRDGVNCIFAHGLHDIRPIFCHLGASSGGAQEEPSLR